MYLGNAWSNASRADGSPSSIRESLTISPLPAGQPHSLIAIMSLTIKLFALNPRTDSLAPFAPMLDRYFARYDEDLACDFTKEDLIENYRTYKMTVWQIFLNGEFQAIGFTDTDTTNGRNTLFLRGMSARIEPRIDGAVHKVNDWIGLVVDELHRLCRNAGIKNMAVSSRLGLIKTYAAKGFKPISAIMILRV